MEPFCVYLGLWPKPSLTISNVGDFLLPRVTRDNTSTKMTLNTRTAIWIFLQKKKKRTIRTYWRIWRAVAYQYTAISRANLGKRAGIRGSSATRFASLPISAQILFPGFIRKILVSDFVLAARSADS